MISYITERIITNNTASVQDATSVATSYTHSLVVWLKLDSSRDAEQKVHHQPKVTSTVSRVT
jgi:hypothetical protein